MDFGANVLRKILKCYYGLSTFQQEYKSQPKFEQEHDGLGTFQ
jgi:hypothetical protein